MSQKDLQADMGFIYSMIMDESTSDLSIIEHAASHYGYRKDGELSQLDREIELLEVKSEQINRVLNSYTFRSSQSSKEKYEVELNTHTNLKSKLGYLEKEVIPRHVRLRDKLTDMIISPLPGDDSCLIDLHTVICKKIKEYDKEVESIKRTLKSVDTSSLTKWIESQKRMVIANKAKIDRQINYLKKKKSDYNRWCRSLKVFVDKENDKED